MTRLFKMTYGTVAALMALSIVQTAQAQRRSARAAGNIDAFAREIAATRRAGLSTTLKELQVPLPPREQNAAVVYAELDKLLKAKPVSAMDEEEVIELHRKKMPPASQAEEARSVMAQRKDILPLVHKAVSRPECVFVRDWAKGPETLFPEYAVMRRAVRWLTAESYLLLLDGKPLDAVRNQARGFQIARHATSDPILTAYLVGTTINAITLVGMEKILYRAGEDPQVADTVRVAVEKLWPRIGLSRSLRGEVPMQIAALEIARKEGLGRLQEIMGGEERSNSPERKSALWRSKTWRAAVERNGVFLLRQMRKILSVADRPYPESGPAIHTLLADPALEKPELALSRLFLPMFENVATVRARDIAQAEIIRVGAAVLAWKGRHGAFPEKLEQALSPIPADPFDGKPLRYRREGDGFVVYSVGEGGDFNGGTPDAMPRVRDLLFRYPLPEYLK